MHLNGTTIGGGLKLAKKRDVWEWVKVFLFAAFLAAVIRYLLFTPIVVDGESMMPTLNDRDRMIVNRISYIFNGPERFDIIVFHATEEKDYIKRVIGLPGEFIEYKNDTLFVNGEAVEEPFLEEAKKKLVGGTLTEPFYIQVPPDHIFVLGDNRRFSKDSRHIGPVPLSEILGEATIIYWPLKDFRFIY